MHNSRIKGWLYSVRDGFISILPLTFFGITALILLNFPSAPYRELMTGTFGNSWVDHITMALNASHGIMGFSAAVAISVHHTVRLNRSQPADNRTSPFLAGTSALMNFALFLEGTGSLSIASMGTSAILPAVITGILTAELLSWIVRSNFYRLVDMPYDTEINVYHSIKLSIPIFLLGVVSLAFSIGLNSIVLPDQNYTLMMLSYLQQLESSSVIINGITALLNQVFWYLGLHGGHLIDTYFSELFNNSHSEYNNAFAWRPILNSFALFGGAGSTMCLLVVIFLTVKEGQQRKIAQISAIPSIFNINESVLYGLPLILNPIYLVPFLIVPVVLSMLAALAIELKVIVPLPVDIPWTTPPLLSGWLLTGSWEGALFQLAQLAIGISIYLPFVKKAEKVRLYRQEQSFHRATEIILNEQQSIKVINRQDEVGLIARGLVESLKYDLTNDNLTLYYQPKHDASGAIIGVEALLRWKHPKHGFINPLVAINLSEESDLTNQLGSWVISKACECLKRWKYQGISAMTMAINISPTQLKKVGFAEDVARTIELNGLHAAEIELEITESQMIEDSSTVNQNLQSLSAFGVKLAMDDFGMGHSSLVYMRKFKVDTIKIDSSITKDVLINKTNANIIATIANFGRSEGVGIVAEFVETLEQRNELVALGCNMFQGHYHSAAISQIDCAKYIKSHSQPKILSPVETRSELVH